MKVLISAQLRPSVVEAAELTSLSVERADGLSETDVDSALRTAGAGRAAEGHAWLAVAWLRDQGPAGDPQWTDGFGEMIAYAASKGWTDPGQESVRAHLA
ncbi:hypothetical protein VSH64_11430 [Amycolatopsis rhabdoformis]|uniref:Uncharacterized protein n=1 Tax=Amycolatopsis rhabdoformis TaxID=1448059 RepID=A0ABZ1IEX9_9PSEU|nr:hypothetical protein [Amycolatopsis rhabdoformis]WSE32713.1 hypothetical protein VSH64_11430 [Amycolatopsis rhabdoformis]